MEQDPLEVVVEDKEVKAWAQVEIVYVQTVDIENLISLQYLAITENALNAVHL